MLSDVIVAGQGGLGNQLFQVATAEALAVERRARVRRSPVRVDDASMLQTLLGEDIPPPSSFALLRCGLTPPGAGGGLSTAMAAVRLLGLAAQRRIGSADAFAPPLVTPRRGPLAVVGYVQHREHFGAGVDKVVQRIVEARRRTAPGPGSTAPQDRTTVHLRRGDYVRLGWALTSTYYAAALEEMSRRLPDIARDVEIVADDAMAADGLGTRLARAGWSIAMSPTRTASGGLELAIEEFWRLADAPRLVMSNSTFCWWAAVVGDAITPGRTVVFPSDWIGAGGDQLWRPGWIRVLSTTDGRVSRADP